MCKTRGREQVNESFLPAWQRGESYRTPSNYLKISPLVGCHSSKRSLNILPRVLVHFFLNPWVDFSIPSPNHLELAFSLAKMSVKWVLTIQAETLKLVRCTIKYFSHQFFISTYPFLLHGDKTLLALGLAKLLFYSTSGIPLGPSE